MSATGSVAAGVYAVGVGPGDPRLLTLRAVEVLAAADLVVAPRGSADSASVALNIVRDRLGEHCEVVELEFPMAESGDERERAWAQAAERLAGPADDGGVAVMITLGDVSLYSTWGYVAEVLRRAHGEVPVEIVPGVSSPFACAATAGVPLAAGREPLLLWPAEPPADLGELFALAPNVVFLKAGRHLDLLADELQRLGKRAVAVRRCGMTDEAVAEDLRSLAEDREYFTTVLARSETTAGEDS